MRLLVVYWVASVSDSKKWPLCSTYMAWSFPVSISVIKRARGHLLTQSSRPPCHCCCCYWWWWWWWCTWSLYLGLSLYYQSLVSPWVHLWIRDASGNVVYQMLLPFLSVFSSLSFLSPVPSIPILASHLAVVCWEISAAAEVAASWSMLNTTAVWPVVTERSMWDAISPPGRPLAHFLMKHFTNHIASRTSDHNRNPKRPKHAKPILLVGFLTFKKQ